MNPVIRLDYVRMSYGDHVVLDAVTLDVHGGQVTAVIGPNGSGKSTLFSAISGLLEPVGGHITALGTTPVRSRRRIAYVLQETRANKLLPMTVSEVVRMGRYARTGMFGRLRSADRSAVDAVLEQMDVADLRHRQLRELSGGQRQRVMVAQGLAQAADVLLLDEPVTGLDLVSQQLITTAMRSETAAGRAVVVSTHDLREAERADFVVLLAGRVVATGPPDRVLTRAHLRSAYGHQLIDLGDEAGTIDEHVHPYQVSTRR